MKSVQWHSMPEKEVSDLLATEPDKGLDSSEVMRRQEQFGSNTITQKNGRGLIVLFLLQFHQPLIYILLVATAMHTAFGSQSIGLREWGLIITASIVVYIVIEFEKWLRN